MEIFIPYNVPSSKNSKEIVKSPNGPRKLISSKITREYIKKTESYYFYESFNFKKMTKGKELPLRVGFKFFRDSRRKFDYINALQIVQDLMVKNKWLEDDNADCILPVFFPYEYRKNNPGVSIFLVN